MVVVVSSSNKIVVIVVVIAIIILGVREADIHNARRGGQCLWKFSGESQRFAETVIFPGKMTNEYRGDLRKRRIRAKTAQNNFKILAREIPHAESPCFVRALSAAK